MTDRQKRHITILSVMQASLVLILAWTIGWLMVSGATEVGVSLACLVFFQIVAIQHRVILIAALNKNTYDLTKFVASNVAYQAVVNGRLLHEAGVDPEEVMSESQKAGIQEIPIPRNYSK